MAASGRLELAGTVLAVATVDWFGVLDACLGPFRPLDGDETEVTATLPLSDFGDPTANACLFAGDATGRVGEFGFADAGVCAVLALVLFFTAAESPVLLFFVTDTL